MADIKISILNESTLVSDDQVRRIVPALQTQVTRDFGPPWGVFADLDFVPSGQQPPPNHWWLIMLDNTDQAGDLGYHDITSDGLPLGKVFVGTDLQYGSSWSVTASHELLEMLGDPAINLTALVQSEFTVNENVVGRLYAYEVCDASEADQYGYQIDGILVSDFVYPSWFEPFRAPGSTQFDQQKLIGSPLQLLPGGYIGIYDMTSGTGWQQFSLPAIPDGQKPVAPARAPVGSRRERRRTPRNQWLVSKPVLLGKATA
jgi:hypothetical protein